jgi:hypothetical protein
MQSKMNIEIVLNSRNITAQIKNIREIAHRGIGCGFPNVSYRVNFFAMME